MFRSEPNVASFILLLVIVAKGISARIEAVRRLFPKCWFNEATTEATLERIMVENAAMSAAVLRDAHVRWMQGQPVPVSELATLENTFNRTAQALGLSRRAKDVMSIDAYLSEKPR
jgi:hypothetical protein